MQNLACAPARVDINRTRWCAVNNIRLFLFCLAGLEYAAPRQINNFALLEMKYGSLRLLSLRLFLSARASPSWYLFVAWRGVRRAQQNDQFSGRALLQLGA